MKRLFLLILNLVFVFNLRAQETQVSSGKIICLKNFTSEYIAARNVEIWLPEGYSKHKKYAVLYMHDGQMLFDSTHNWAHKEWGVDETIGSLIQQKLIRNCIVVGIWNSGMQRHDDYFPQKPFESLSQYQQDTIYRTKRFKSTAIFSGKIQSDNYLKFIVKELKPYIDSAFSVNSNRSNTFIAGSSMGGLISMYAICEYPNIFGGAACLSTHWPGIFTNENNPIPDAFFNYLANNLPDPKHHQLYFDYGTSTLDTLYAEHQKRVNNIVLKKGYSKSSFMSKVFDGDGHAEEFWAKRLFIPMTFLLKK